MALLLLLRHAHHDLLGRELVGRRPGVRLSAQGRREAALVARGLAEVPLAAILASPRERCQETAAAVAEPHGLPIETVAALDEIDFGDWTGRCFAELERDPDWQRFNEARSRMAIPGGERMIEAQTRAIDLIERLARRGDARAVLLTTHGDMIRAVLVHYLGMPLDFIHRIDVAPASLSVLEIGERQARVRAINRLAEPWAGLGTRV